MDFELTENQKMLATAARSYLSEKCPPKLVRELVKTEVGYSLDMWREIAQMGWLGVVIPESYGGMGGNFVDLAVLLEEIGRACLPGPFFTTAVVAAATIIVGGSQEQKKEYLPRVAQGSAIITLALTEQDGEYKASSIKTEAKPKDGHHLIKGKKLFVPDADAADYIACVVRTDLRSEQGLTLLLIPRKTPGVKCNLLTTINGDRQYEVALDNVKGESCNVVGNLNQGWAVVQKVLQIAAIAKCAEMLGGAQRALEMSIEYAKTRKQGGHIIGSYQAVQHHVANMVLDVNAARMLTYQAAWKLASGLPCNKEVAMAKAWAGKSYCHVTLLGQQIHGAIAYCEDHDMPLYSRSAVTNEVAFGDADFHLETVAKELGM